MNDPNSLAMLVRDMRAAQKTYFRERTGNALAEAKRLERQVDMAIKAILEPETEDKQEELGL